MSDAPTFRVFDKLAMSAFAGIPLEMALRDLGIRAFAIAGVRWQRLPRDLLTLIAGKAA